MKVFALLSLFVFCALANAASVAVHDPSIVIAYIDAGGNSFPENDAAKTRTKHYYVFGTMLGAAHSTDMINWTSFTPSMLLNGNISTDYYQIFKAEADYAVHTTSSEVLGNLWAPDVIYNKVMKKWCLYISLSGNDFKSSIVLLTSDKIEGPYQMAGAVVYGGFTNATASVGRSDYQKVTGSSTVDARYLKNGSWNNDYAVSCIDPAVLYDQKGNLWLTYGSWSGGIFLLNLNPATGLRNTAWDYGYGATPSWNGSRLRYDPYMGVHIGGGYYVSGEGPYIEYLVDNNGVGYYYLFVSMGFYSPEGGYTMRVFRSATIDGEYTDVSGDDAVFPQYVFNYGANTQYGFPIMGNYKWSWWSVGEIAQGHNSALRDEDGSSYLVYHRKMDNGTAWHNVEVHQMLFNEQGWPLAAPFEYRRGFGNTQTTFAIDQIAGAYGAITHAPVDYANLATNQEQILNLNADGSITGAYTGTWTYQPSNGSQYITLTTTAGTFHGVINEFLMNDTSAMTTAFTAMNPGTEQALWGYRLPKTYTTKTTHYRGHSLAIGTPDFQLDWDDYASFHKENVAGEFEIEYTFENRTLAAENWHNWALVFQNGSESWYLRSDAWSNSTFSGSTVNHKSDWNGPMDFKSAYANKALRIKASRMGESIHVFAYVGDQLVYTATANNTPDGNYTVSLGGESCYLIVNKVSVRAISQRRQVGSTNDDGTYPVGFNIAQSDTTTVSGDFELKYRFVNYHNPNSTDNWDNYIIKASSGNQTMHIRSDAYSMNNLGSLAFTYDWKWEDFTSIMSGATIDLAISRTGDLATYKASILARDGSLYNYQILQSQAPTSSMDFGLTCEKSMLDILETEIISTTGVDDSSSSSNAQSSSSQEPSSSSESASSSSGSTSSLNASTSHPKAWNYRVYSLTGKLHWTGTQYPHHLERGVWIVQAWVPQKQQWKQFIKAIP